MSFISGEEDLGNQVRFYFRQPAPSSLRATSCLRLHLLLLLLVGTCQNTHTHTESNGKERTKAWPGTCRLLRRIARPFQGHSLQSSARAYERKRSCFLPTRGCDAASAFNFSGSLAAALSSLLSSLLSWQPPRLPSNLRGSPRCPSAVRLASGLLASYSGVLTSFILCFSALM